MGRRTSEEADAAPRTKRQKRLGHALGDDTAQQPQSAPQPQQPASLTRKNLARLDRMTRKKASASPAGSAPPGGTTGTTRTTLSASADGFGKRAIGNGILDLAASRTPTNARALDARLTRHTRHTRHTRQGSAAPTKLAFDNYVSTITRAGNEATVMTEMLLRLFPVNQETGYKLTINRQFTGFPKKISINNGLSAPQPDFVEGPTWMTFLPFPADDVIDGAVLYRDDLDSVTLPHLAGDWTGPDGSMAEADWQSAHVGAALVYARNKALAYLGRPDPHGHAEVVTFTTNGVVLNFFAHYAAPDSSGALRYHQYQYASVNMVRSYDDHRSGWQGLLNARDGAREAACALRDALREAWVLREAEWPAGTE